MPPVPEMVTIPDPGAPSGVGQIRVDRRPAAGPAAGPPLILLGGMTQTLSSWSAHLRSLAQAREVIAYEARGQGHSGLDLSELSPRRLVDDFIELLRALDLPGPVDLCGFSFGGRLAMAIAAAHPQRIRRLVVSGVAAGRSALGRVIVRGWRAALDTGDLRALAWISLADTLGPDYLARHEAMLPAFVDATVQRNSYAGIRALFERTMDDVADAAFAPLALAPRIRAPALLICGEHDRLAPPDELDALALAFTPRAETIILPGAGHTVAIESPAPWRERVLEFLDRPGAA